MKDFARISIVGLAVFAPLAAFATDLGNILGVINGLIKTATPIVVALALLGFFWGLATYIFSAGNPKNQAKGRSIMIWGILALFVMLSVFGIVGALQSTFTLQNVTIPIPSVNTNTYK
jgi:hypothetical protein